MMGAEAQARLVTLAGDALDDSYRFAGHRDRIEELAHGVLDVLADLEVLSEQLEAARNDNAELARIRPLVRAVVDWRRTGCCPSEQREGMLSTAVDRYEDDELEAARDRRKLVEAFERVQAITARLEIERDSNEEEPTGNYEPLGAVPDSDQTLGFVHAVLR